jgi:hypothetical protein
MGEPLNLLAESITVESLDRPGDPRMKLAPTLLQRSIVGDVMRKRMLEGVREIRKQSRLVDELGGLQAVEPAAKVRFRQFRDRLEQGKRHLVTHDGGRLEQALVL